MSAPTVLAAVVLAHQGGWDEILLVLTPIALFTGLLWLANRRASRGLGDGGPEPSGEDEEPGEAGAGPTGATGEADGTGEPDGDQQTGGGRAP